LSCNLRIAAEWELDIETHTFLATSSGFIRAGFLSFDEAMSL
jgi:hypothetical protein